MKKTFFIFLATFLFLIVSFLMGETILRLSGRYYTFSENSPNGGFWFEWGVKRTDGHYSHEKNSVFVSSNGENEWEYNTNQLGFRERKIEWEHNDTSLVFTLGDSFTEGLGTSFDSTWPRVLENKLFRSATSRLYNCGMSGSDPFYAHWLIKNKLSKYKPSHLILAINDSDFDDYLIRGGFKRFKEDGSVKYNNPPEFYTSYRYSHIIRAVIHEFFNYDYYLINRTDNESNLREAADSIANCLRSINQLCLKNDIKFMAVIHPVPHKICFETEGDFSDVLSISHDFNFPVVRMYEPLKAKMLKNEDCTSFHWKTDSHFNGKGYHLFANVLYEEIIKDYPSFFKTPDPIN